MQQVNEGKFIDPGGNPLQLLDELKQIHEEGYSVRARLLDLSKWKEAISGKPHNLSRVYRYNFSYTHQVSNYINKCSVKIYLALWIR